MVSECLAHDSKLPVLKLESRGYDQSQHGLVLLWPSCKSAFRAKQTSTGTNDRLGRSKMTHNVISLPSINALRKAYSITSSAVA